MCLTRTDKSIIKGKAVKKGYKIFTKIGDTLLCEWWGEGKPRLVGKWLDEKDFRDGGVGDSLFTTSRKKYNIGWHVFLSEKDADKIVKAHLPAKAVRKIKIRQAVSSGFENYASMPLRVVVCKKIFILEKKKG